MLAISHVFRRASLIAATAVLWTACAPGAQVTPAQQRHVFVIVMENHKPAQVLAAPFVGSLAATYRVAANYRALTHPSLPNYLALTSGQTWGVTDDSFHVLPKSDIGHQLTAAGVTWRAYMEGLTSAGCQDSLHPYDRDHNPFALYGGECPPNVVPFQTLRTDLAQSAPRFIWITPDDCHNTHDCPLQVGDDWLRQTVTLITGSDAFKNNGVLFITWDENDGSPYNRVLTLVVTPGASHKVSLQPYNHYSLLATIEDLLGVGRLGNAAGAAAMQDLVEP